VKDERGVAVKWSGLFANDHQDSAAAVRQMREIRRWHHIQ
jgi:hypothetical protein